MPWVREMETTHAPDWMNPLRRELARMIRVIMLQGSCVDLIRLLHVRGAVGEEEVRGAEELLECTGVWCDVKVNLMLTHALQMAIMWTRDELTKSRIVMWCLRDSGGQPMREILKRVEDEFAAEAR